MESKNRHIERSASSSNSLNENKNLDSSSQYLLPNANKNQRKNPYKNQKDEYIKQNQSSGYIFNSQISITQNQ